MDERPGIVRLTERNFGRVVVVGAIGGVLMIAARELVPDGMSYSAFCGDLLIFLAMVFLISPSVFIASAFKQSGVMRTGIIVSGFLFLLATGLDLTKHIGYLDTWPIVGGNGAFHGFARASALFAAIIALIATLYYTIIQFAKASIRLEMDQAELVRETSGRKQAESALRSQQELVQAIIDKTPAIVYVKDLAGRYLLMNEKCVEVFQIDRSEIGAKSDFDIFPQSVAELVRENDLAVLRDGLPMEFEEELSHNDHALIFHSLKFPMLNESGAIYAVCGISTDITQRKQSETERQARIARAERFQQLLLDFALLPEFSQGNLDKAAQYLVPRLAEVFGVDRVHVWDMKLGGREAAGLVAHYESSSEGVATNLRIAPGIVERMREGKPVICDSVPDAPDMRALIGDDASGIQSFFYSPVLAGGRLYGVICLELTRQRRTWQPDEIAFCESLVIQLGQLFLNHRVFEQEIESQRLGEIYRRAIAAAGAAPYIEIYEPSSYAFMGDQIVRLTGYTAEEVTPALLNKIIVEYVLQGPGAGMPLEEAIERARRGEFEYWQCDMQIRTKSGDLRWISEISVESLDATGHAVSSVGLILDITDRVQREREVRRVEEVYRNAIAAAGAVPYFHVYKPEERYTFLDPHFADITGYPIEELTPEKLREITIEDVILGDNAGYEHDAAISRTRAGATDVWLSLFVVRTKQGDIRWLQDTAVEMPGPDGRSIGSVGLIIDVTEAKRTEEALRESEARFRGYFENGLIGMAIISPDDRLTRSNDRLCEILGYRQAELDNRVWSEFTYPDDIMADRIPRAEIIAGHADSYAVEKRLVRQDGSIVFAEIAVRCQRKTDGAPDYFLAVIQDISERKRADGERIDMERRLLHAQKLESLGVLAGGIAHDFNNLLAAMVGNLDLAMDTLPRASSEMELVQQAYQAARRASDLTRQLLAYSGKGQFRVDRLDLSNLVEENARMLRSAVPRNVVLNLDLGAALPSIAADAGQIQQVVMNLITNAAEAIGDRDGVVKLSTGKRVCDAAYLAQSRCEPLAEPGEFVYVEVMDTGCGMSPETLSRLFDPFFTTKFTGRGLGMSAILGIVRGHNAAILVESEVEQGTTIRVLFPAAETKDETNASEADNAPERHNTANKNIRILVIDDEDMVRTLCTRMLEHLGYQVMVAADGEEGSILFREHADEIDCVILDLTMPRLDGESTFHLLKAVKPEIKVILSSGFDEQQVSQRFTGQRLAGFLQKPFGLEELRKELARVL